MDVDWGWKWISKSGKWERIAEKTAGGSFNKDEGLFAARSDENIIATDTTLRMGTPNE